MPNSPDITGGMPAAPPPVQTNPAVAGSQMPGSFNFDVSSPGGLISSTEENAKSSGDFINGLGQFLFGENNGSMLGGTPIGALVRGASAVPGVKLVSDVAGAALSGGVGAVVGAAQHIPMGWIPGGTDSIFASMPHTADWQAVEAASNSDILGGANQKFDYIQKQMENAQGAIKDSSGFATIDSPLLAGPGGSLAKFAGQLMGLVQVPQRLVERGLAGTAKVLSGENRVQETLDRAQNDPTSLSPAEQAVVQHMGDGTWTEQRSLDFLASHGSGLSHDSILEMAGAFATDPTVIASLAGAGVARLAKVGTDVIEAGMAGNETLTGIQKAGVVAAQFKAGELGPVARIAQTLIDPLGAIAGKTPSGMAVKDLLTDNIAVKGFHNAFGLGAPQGYRVFDAMGVTADAMDAAAGRGTTVALQLLAARRQAWAIANGLGRDLLETVPRGSVVDDLLSHAPGNIEQMVREEVQRTWKFNWNAEDKVTLATDMAQSFGGDAEAWAKEINAASDDTLAFMHNLKYGQDEKEFRLAWQKGALDYAGTVDYARLNMVNDSTLHSFGAKSLLDVLDETELSQKAIDAGFTDLFEYKAAQLGDWQKRFPELKKYQIEKNNPGKAVEWAQKDITKKLKNGEFPMMITEREMGDMPQGIRDFVTAHPSRILAMRPEDGQLWNIERDLTTGKYISAGNPWVEHVMSGVTYRPGFALPTNLAGQTLARAIMKPMDWLESGTRLLTKRVSSTAIQENALQRAVKYATSTLGISEEDTRKIFRGLTQHLDLTDKAYD